MVCPYCMNGTTSVYNSRRTSQLNNVWRRRRCDRCDKTFTTNETVDPRSVIKVQSGRAFAKFSPTKLMLSLVRACDHLEDPEVSADYLYQTIVQKLYTVAAMRSQMINKTDISMVTLEVLKNYNLPAYVKYLSYNSPNIGKRDLSKHLRDVTS